MSSYSHYYSDYPCYDKNNSSSHFEANIPLAELSENCSSSEYYNSYASNRESISRAANVYINPNTVFMSGSVHINKNKFNVNQNAQSCSNFEYRTASSLPENKIHYNPKFLPKSQRKNEISKAKNIHVNPNFTNNININKHADCAEPSSYSDICYSSKSYYDFPMNSLDSNSVTYSSEESMNNSVPVNSNVDKVVSSCSESSSIDLLKSSYQLPLVYPKTHMANKCYMPSKSDSFSPFIQTQTCFNSKYSKVNNASSLVPKLSPKISKYKVLRNNIPQNTMALNYSNSSKIVSPKYLKLPVRKPRISGTFKKIGKRKLVRKSLIQSYISSRRQSLPSMIQHSRNTLASRRKLRLISKTKYKLIRGDLNSKIKLNPVNIMSTCNKINSSPIHSKLKWYRNNSSQLRSQEFIKIGKRKIVRKSILQSIIEARRNNSYIFKRYSPNKNYPESPKKKNKMNLKNIKSRYKVVRNPSSSDPTQALHLNRSVDHRKRTTSLSINKVSGFTNFNSALKSKSILYRMPPSLRFKIKMEEKRKMLLKKVNNKKKCSFYNRFGYCKGFEEGSCKKLHDSKSVSICRKYLKGMCHGDDCKLSHQVVPEKMPTCHQFLAGVCVRAKCPFLHVKLSDDRPICPDFIQGFCQHGNSCSKRHQFICPDWADKRICNNGKCPYPHPSNSPKQRKFNTIKENIVTSVNEPIGKSKEEPSESNSTDDLKTRYFSNNCDEISPNGSGDCENPNSVERKPEVKDGVNSVYNSESLMAFIPFS